MKVYPCQVCGAEYTQEEIRAGNAVVAERRVYCAEHAPQAQSAASSSSRRRAAQSAPASQAPNRGPMILIIMLVCIIGLLGAIAAVLLLKKPTPQVPSAEPRTAEAPAAPEPAEPTVPAPGPDGTVPEPAEPAAAGPGDMAPGLTPEQLAVLKKEYEAAEEEADDICDGTIPAYEKARRLLQTRVIGAARFKDTAFIALAEEFLGDKKDEVDIGIQAEYSKLEKQLQAMVQKVQFIQAEKEAEKFPREYRRFGEWGERFEGMKKGLREQAVMVVESSIRTAREKAKEKSVASAVADLKELVEISGGNLYPDLVERLEKEASLIKTGGAVGETPGIDISGQGAAALLTIADGYYNQGDLAEAETLYKELLASFGSDEAVMPRKGEIAGRLGEIGQLKEKNRDDRIAVSWYETFDYPISYALDGTIDSKEVFGKKGKSFRSKQVPENTYFSERLGFQDYRKEKAHERLFRAPAAADSYLTFWFYLGGEEGFNWFMYQGFNQTQSKNFKITLKNLVTKKWSFACIPLSRLKVIGEADAVIQDGDLFADMSFYTGKPGMKGRVTLLIDEIAVVTGSNQYHIKVKMAEKRQIMGAIASDPKKDHYTMNVRTLDTGIRILEPGMDANKVLAFGGFHVKSGFLKKCGPRVVMATGSKKPQFLMENALSILQKDLADEKPAMTAFLIGTNDIVQKKDLVDYMPRLEALVLTCMEAGSVPVLFTLPHIIKEPDLSPKVTALNDRIRTVAKKYHLPLVDGYNALAAEFKGSFANQYSLKTGGYRKYNDRFKKIYEAFVKYGF